MFRTAITSLFLASLVFTPQGFSDPSADVSLSKNKIETGETAELRLQFHWPKAEAAYTFAVPELPLQNLTVTNQAESQETFLKENQEWTQKDFIFELSPKGTGEGEIGAFPVVFVNPATGAQGQYAVSALKIQISKARSKRNIFPLAAVLAFVSTAAALTVLFRRRKKGSGEPAVPAQKQAVLAIKNRVQTAQLSTEDAVANLGRELREFLKEIYSIPVSHKSESEVLADLKNKNLQPDELRTLERLLSQIREVKYTGQRMSEIDFQILKKEITAFIDSKQIVSFSSSH